jgi:hypothetical protein
MGATLDLRKAHLSRQHGDLTAIYTWINDERAMVLLPTYRTGAPWYVVCESAAYKYDDPAYLARQCVTACEVLGIEPSTPNWSRVASIIHEGLPELIRMPSAPLPEYLRGSFGHMELRADGQVIAGEDIRIEREGAAYG